MTRLPSPLTVAFVFPAPDKTWTFTPENWIVGLPPTPEATNFINGASALKSASSDAVKAFFPSGPSLPSAPVRPVSPFGPSLPSLPSAPGEPSLPGSTRMYLTSFLLIVFDGHSPVLLVERTCLLTASGTHIAVAAAEADATTSTI